MLALKAHCNRLWNHPRQRVILSAALLALFSLLLYANALDNEFIWDGTETFLDDPSIRDFSYLPSYFTGAVTNDIAKEGRGFAYLNYYRPLVRVVHLLEYQAFAENPLGYHAVSILLNALVVILAFLLVNTITGNSLLALVATLLFAAHPSHPEAVSWAYSDSYLWFSVFSLASLFWFWRQRYIPSLLTFTCALLSQESAVLLPLVLLLMRWLLQDAKQLREYRNLIPYVILVAVFLVARTLAVGATPLTDVGLLTLLNAAVTIIATSVKVFFLPDAPITLYHYRPGMFDVLNASLVASYVVSVGLLGAALWLWRCSKPLLFWLLWFFVWIVVMFNVGKFAEFYFMDKILYLSSLGGCVLLAQGLLAIPSRAALRAALVAAAVCTFAGMSLWRAAYWDNEQVYFEQALKFAPDFPLLRYATANLYRDQGKLEQAMAEYKITVQLQPDHSYAHNNLGNLYFMRNDYDRAVDAWQQALKADAANPQPYYNIGVALERQGKIAQALGYYRQYLTHQPRPPAAVLRHIRQLQGRK